MGDLAIGMSAGNLSWRRVRAGFYVTEYWANGYQYQIKSDEYYGWKWYYRFFYSKAKNWVLANYTPYSYYADTLKAAKAICANHNRFPRRKWKFVGVFTKEDAGNSNYMQKHIGLYQYNEVNRDGVVLKHSYRFLNPKEIGGVDPTIGAEEERRKKEQEAMEQLAKAVNAVYQSQGETNG